MGRRTGKEPGAEDSFVWRICHALDQKPTDLARNIGVTYKELAPLIDCQAYQMGDTDMDELWFKLEAYVSKNIGYLMAARQEITRTMRQAKAQRALRTERFKAHHGK